MNRLLKVPEVARILNLSKTQTYRLLSSGELDHYQLTQQRFGVSEEQLQDFLTRRLIKVDKK